MNADTFRYFRPLNLNAHTFLQHAKVPKYFQGSGLQHGHFRREPAEAAPEEELFAKAPGRRGQPSRRAPPPRSEPHSSARRLRVSCIVALLAATRGGGGGGGHVCGANLGRIATDRG